MSNKYLEIVAFKNGEVVQRIDVTDKTESQIERIERGMQINLNLDNYYTREVLE